MFLAILRLVVRLILNLFFREIKEGPVLFAVAPHSNQFVDPLMLVTTCGRNVGFLAAKKSMDKFWIGMFARWLNSIPVERPQDLAKKGDGTIYVRNNDSLRVFGIGTKFTALSVKSILKLPGGAGEALVLKIISDDELVLQKSFSDEAAISLLSLVDESGKITGTSYFVIPHIDQSIMFKSVISRLTKNQAIGIFPEGGSHDRPEMLPLKAGVAIMALETLAKYPGTKLKIIPTGLHYFNSDKFRSRAVLEYGEPIELPIELLDEYKKGGAEKRQAISLLLDTIHIRLKTLTLQAPDFESLMVAQASRRLYQTQNLNADSSLIVSRRFTAAYEKCKDHEKVKNLTQEVLKYNRMLKFYGVRDHQVRNTSIDVKTALIRIFFRMSQLLFLFVIAAPVIVLLAPLILLTQRVSHEKMKEAKAGSTVKLVGKDVVTTWKLLTALVVAPLLWIFYAFICFLYYFWYYSYSAGIRAAIIFAIFWPIVSASAVYLADFANDLSSSIRPLIVSVGNMMSSSEPLREMRNELQIKIRSLVEELGPEVFENFEDIRLVKKEDYQNEGMYNTIAAQKLGRGNNLESPTFDVDEVTHFTVFGK